MPTEREVLRMAHDIAVRYSLDPIEVYEKIKNMSTREFATYRSELHTFYSQQVLRDG